MKNLSLFISLVWILSACVYTTKQICNDSNVRDIPGIEGKFLFKSYSLTEFEMISDRFEIQRISRGHYSFNGKGDSSACVIGGVVYFEGPSEQGFSSYRIEPFSSESGERGFHMMLLGVSKKELERRNIPFKIIETSGSYMGMNFLAPESKSKALVLDNSKLSSDETAQLLEPMSASFSFIPTR